MRYARVSALIGVVENSGGFLYAVLIRGDGKEVHRAVSRIRGATLTATFFEAISYTLGAARRHGRTLRMAINDAGVVAVLSRRQEVTNEYVTPFLVARALMHAYRQVDIVEPTGEEKTALAGVVADALHHAGAPLHLPLWRAASEDAAA